MGRAVLIVGGGIAGLSTAWSLSRRGWSDVLLVERGELGGQASRQNASILKELSSDPVTAELARRGADFLRNPPAGFADGPLVEECGLFLVADEASATRLEAVLRSAHGVPFERLSPARLAQRLPFYRGPLAEAAFFPRDGRIHVHRVLEAYARGAREGGVELWTGRGVRELLREDGRVLGVRLEDGSSIHAETTVLASGAWAGEMARQVGSRLEFRPTRRHLLVTGSDDRLPPEGAIVWRLDESFYARPERGGWLACTCDQTDVEPDRLAPDPSEQRAIMDAARASLDPAPTGEPQDFWCGMRTFTPDGRFAIGPDPDLDGLFWVAGLGGAGMGTGPAVGELAASLLTGEATQEPWAQALAPARFRDTAVGS